MNDRRSLEAADARTGQSPSKPQGSMYRFSPEELRVLKECNEESFYKRSLPLGTAIGMGTFAAIRTGYFKPSPRFGPFPKVTLAVIAGYILGRLSYQNECAEKLMALPDSYVGQLLRDKRNGNMNNMPKKPPPMFGAGPDDIYSDAGPGISLEFDVDRPIFNEDTYHPDADVAPSEPITPPRSGLSYDDLRRKNRDQYSDATQDPYKVDPFSVRPVPQRPPPPPAAPRTNKYGDGLD